MRVCKVDNSLLGILQVFLLWFGYFDFGAAVHGAMLAEMMTYSVTWLSFQWQNVWQGQLKEGKVCFSSKFESTAYNGREGGKQERIRLG